jgi:hypothetical protein
MRRRRFGQTGAECRRRCRQADADAGADRRAGRALPHALPLQARSARREDVAADLRSLSRRARFRPPVPVAVGRRPFAASRDKLGDAIYDQDLTAPFAIFNLYVQRVAERTAYSQELLKQGFDFSKDESYRYQRDKLPWAKTTEELNDVWQKRVKNDWLRLKLAGKKEADIRTTLEKRYANYGDRLRQLNAEDVFQTFMNAYAMAIERTRITSARAPAKTSTSR